MSEEEHCALFILLAEFCELTEKLWHKNEVKKYLKFAPELQFSKKHYLIFKNNLLTTATPTDNLSNANGTYKQD
jgi:hypothetical protein